MSISDRFHSLSCAQDARPHGNEERLFMGKDYYLAGFLVFKSPCVAQIC